MFLISTRNFPPDIGGIQNLMEGLSIALLEHGPVKVFADNYKNCEIYDKKSKCIEIPLKHVQFRHWHTPIHAPGHSHMKNSQKHKAEDSLSDEDSKESKIINQSFVKKRISDNFRFKLHLQ